VPWGVSSPNVGRDRGTPVLSEPCEPERCTATSFARERYPRVRMF
jgi:hypothetical protein